MWYMLLMVVTIMDGGALLRVDLILHTGSLLWSLLSPSVASMSLWLARNIDRRSYGGCQQQTPWLISQDPSVGLKLCTQAAEARAIGTEGLSHG